MESKLKLNRIAAVSGRFCDREPEDIIAELYESVLVFVDEPSTGRPDGGAHYTFMIRDHWKRIRNRLEDFSPSAVMDYQTDERPNISGERGS